MDVFHDFPKIEESIRGEWNIVRAFVANNQLLTLAIALVVGWIVGKVI